MDIEKEKTIIVIGNGENHAGLFNKNKKTITLIVVLKGNSDVKKEQKSNMFERFVLMSGIIYEKNEKHFNEIYTLEIFNITQLERLAPMISKMYSDYKMDVDVEIDKSCYRFLNGYKKTENI